jgi:hypothetical protein
MIAQRGGSMGCEEESRRSRLRSHGGDDAVLAGKCEMSDSLTAKRNEAMQRAAFRAALTRGERGSGAIATEARRGQLLRLGEDDGL